MRYVVLSYEPLGSLIFKVGCCSFKHLNKKVTIMRKTLLALVIFVVSFQVFSFSPKDLSFKCHSEDLIWKVEKEKDVFVFWFDGRIVAYRHLAWDENQLFTNDYDLDFRIVFEEAQGRGSLRGRLMGKNWLLEGLICKKESKF